MSHVQVKPEPNTPNEKKGGSPQVKRERPNDFGKGNKQDIWVRRNRNDRGPPPHGQENFGEGKDGGSGFFDQRGGGGGPRGPDRRNQPKMSQYVGPVTNLESRLDQPKKFTGRCRLFVGNLPVNMTDDAFKALFAEFGAVSEAFLNKQKCFGFVRLETRQQAEAAKSKLDCSMKEGKPLRVRFATHGAALKVKHLSPFVSNELLEAAFSLFGELERAVVIVDDRGRSVGEGIVEFSRKQAAQLAIKRCTDGCFFITSSPRPVHVEPLEQRDEEDGLLEKNIPKNRECEKEREFGPRFADPGTFEFEYGNRWKKLYELERQKRDNLEREIIECRHQLDDQMEYASYEHETNMLREKLRFMEEQSTMLVREREMRMEDKRRRDDQRRQEELLLRQQQDEILRRRNEDMRMREEMMQQEAAMRQMCPPEFNDMEMMGPGGGPGGPGMPNNANVARQNRFEQPPPGGMGAAGPRGRDMGDPRDFEEYDMDAKRRRY